MIGPDGLRALHASLLSHAAEQAVTVLQEAGYGAGGDLYQAFVAWLPRGTGFAKPEDIGAAQLSAVVYLTIGVLLARSEPRRRLRVFWFLLAVLIAALVGASRVFLGVHYPTDVMAGWAVGVAWAAVGAGLSLIVRDDHPHALAG